jgi:hypothetical protein
MDKSPLELATHYGTITTATDGASSSITSSSSSSCCSSSSSFECFLLLFVVAFVMIVTTTTSATTAISGALQIKTSIKALRIASNRRRFTRLLNENLLSSDDYSIYEATMTSSGFRKWLGGRVGYLFLCRTLLLFLVDCCLW